ncbi:hypothetical protein [Aeriscardovia aeriphila]|uniref:Uncharacterized protein n=1 Tax=Aeriscardovia aeriphila TaxID=218139 RepID=A0A261FBL3_9BIFI|nr:hypothetical protein [Aeriscardovia aeriphila]NYI25298.1 hypothetical protein [Aeriscardovia aeriphila]OZG56547.1 hypothetical protein AEAE_1035 [Aeriscardovia aeriphila]
MPLHYTSVADAGIQPINLAQMRQDVHLDFTHAACLLSVEPEVVERWERNLEVLPVAVYKKYVATLEKAGRIYQQDPDNLIFTIDLASLDRLDHPMTYTACTEEYVEQVLALGVDFPEDFWPYEFVPEYPIVLREQIAYETEGIEPYPGFGEAWETFQDNLDEVDSIVHQILADQGGKVLYDDDDYYGYDLPDGVNFEGDSVALADLARENNTFDDDSTFDDDDFDDGSTFNDGDFEDANDADDDFSESYTDANFADFAARLSQFSSGQEDGAPSLRYDNGAIHFEVVDLDAGKDADTQTDTGATRSAALDADTNADAVTSANVNANAEANPIPITSARIQRGDGSLSASHSTPPSE